MQTRYYTLSVVLAFVVGALSCKDSQDHRPASAAPGGENATLAATGTPAKEIPPVSTTESIATKAFHPVLLDSFYQRLFSSYKPTESWALVPRGLTDLDGVPFRMLGKIDLTGMGRARDGEFQPARVGEIPVGQRAARIHLLHGASYDAPDGTPIAALRLHYAGGTEQMLFVRYGVHARNWYVERSEKNETLTDPRSLVVWNGNTRPDGTGTPTRLFKTTFDNPQPGQEIRSIELLSLFARANSVVLAITLETSPASGTPSELIDESDIDLRREMLVRTLDESTRVPLSNVVVELRVNEGDRQYRFGSYRSDRHGQILIDYPPGQFQELFLRMAGPDIEPGALALKSDDGLFTSDLPVFLKRSVPLDKEIVGVGLIVVAAQDNGALMIAGAIPNSPAAEAGLAGRFILRKIDGTPTQGMKIPEAVSLMRGTAGTKVTLELLDPANNEPKTVELTRRKFLVDQPPQF